MNKLETKLNTRLAATHLVNNNYPYILFEKVDLKANPGVPYPFVREFSGNEKAYRIAEYLTYHEKSYLYVWWEVDYVFSPIKICKAKSGITYEKIKLILRQLLYPMKYKIDSIKIIGPERYNRESVLVLLNSGEPKRFNFYGYRCTGKVFITNTECSWFLQLSYGKDIRTYLCLDQEKYDSLKASWPTMDKEALFRQNLSMITRSLFGDDSKCGITKGDNLSRIAKIISQVAYVKGTFKLRSGATSNEYFDKYLFESKPQLLYDIAQAMAEFLPRRIDGIVGMELGGVPLAIVLSQITDIPVVFVRKKAKEYGTCKLVEGGKVKGQHLVIIEDIITSAGQVIESTRVLRKRGAIVTDVICVIDREVGGVDKLATKGLKLQALLTLTDLKRALG